MKTLRIAAAAGLLAVSFAGAALAQDTSSAMQPTAAAPPMTVAPDTATAPMTPSADTSATNSNATAPSAAPTDQTIVTNGPVPDTPANRAKYGAPMSRTGKLTKPAGN